MATISHIGYFPFCVKEAELWDGETYFLNDPSASSSSYVPVVGVGTLYPVAMTLQEMMTLYWRTRVIQLQAESIYVNTFLDQSIYDLSFATVGDWELLVSYPNGDPEEVPEIAFEAFDSTFTNSEDNLVCSVQRIGSMMLGTEFAPSDPLPSRPSSTEPDADWFSINPDAGLFTTWGEATGGFAAYMNLFGFGKTALKVGDEYYPNWELVFEWGSPDGFSEVGYATMSSVKRDPIWTGYYNFSTGFAGNVSLDGFLSGKTIPIYYYRSSVWDGDPPFYINNATISFPQWFTYNGRYDENTGELVE